MKMTYGIAVQENDDPFVTLIEHANDNFNIASTPGIYCLFDFTRFAELLLRNLSR
jgi:hypothetical protein